MCSMKLHCNCILSCVDCHDTNYQWLSFFSFPSFLLSLYIVFTLQILMNVLATHMAVNTPVSTHQEVTGVLVGVDMHSALMEKLVMVSVCIVPFMYICRCRAQCCVVWVTQHCIGGILCIMCACICVCVCASMLACMCAWVYLYT